jgi:hypothetical protein
LPCVDYPKTELVLARQSIIKVEIYKTGNCFFFTYSAVSSRELKVKKLKKINQIDSNSKQTDEIYFLFIAIRSTTTTKPFCDNTYLCGLIVANIFDEHRNVPTD